jgi:hypothetical protein
MPQLLDIRPPGSYPLCDWPMLEGTEGIEGLTLFVKIY